MRVSRYLKEELALAIDTETVSVYYFLIHYPTRDMQISYKQAFGYPNNSIIQTFLKIEKYKGGWITEGLL